MAVSSYTDANKNPLIAQPVSAETGKPDQQTADSYDDGGVNIDKQYIELCLADAERAEQEWRKRGRDIVAVYRNDSGAQSSIGKPKKGGQTYNILFANTEVMLPAIYQRPPKPVVRSRFTGGSVEPPGMPMPMGGPAMPPAPGGLPPAPGGLPPGGPLPPGPLLPPGAPILPPTPAPGGEPLPGVSPPGGVPVPPSLPPDMPQPAVPQPQGPAGLGVDINVNLPPPPPQPLPPPPMPPTMTGPLPQPAPGRPPQADIETAAAVMEKALEIVLDDEESTEAVKTAIKDVLLPGRGVCRVRWKPQIESQPIQDPVMGGQLTLPGMPDQPQSQDVKVWEQVNDEYVYWEDFLVDPVRQHGDVGWEAFRHLFTKEQLLREFADSSPEFQKLVADNKVGELLKWTEESAAKSTPGGGSAMKTSNQKGDVVRKAMVWEVWIKETRQIVWYCRDGGGLILRVDPDTLDLSQFFPVPKPMLSVTTSDSRIPKAFYDLYVLLAQDLEDTSKRISALTKQVKVRGVYNGASSEIAALLSADDQKMIGVAGVDLIAGGLQNHIWLFPIDEHVKALQELYLARDQIRQAIYEIMGISDIMRGATKASETATAQRIKGQMGSVRLEDQRAQAASFARDLMRLKAEIIAKNFDASTLERMTGEQVTPEVEAILRNDFQRTCSIDIETDSTVQVDEQAEQQGMTQVMASIQAIMQGVMAMLQVPMLPPNQSIQLGLELLRMALHPVRYSRGVIELLDDFKEQLQMSAMMPQPPMMPPGAPMMPPGVAPMAKPPGLPGSPPGPPMGGPRQGGGHPGGFPLTGGPPAGNGGAPPPTGY
jgi:hypothetical protein